MLIDKLDASIIDVFTKHSRIGVLEVSRRLGVARGTVQARLERLQREGVVRGFGPVIDAARLGFPVGAFVTAEIAQGQRSPFVTHLEGIPEVLEAHTITGSGDVLIRLVARSNQDLQRVLDKIVQSDSVLRTSTVVVLESQVKYRTGPLVETAAEGL